MSLKKSYKMKKRIGCLFIVFISMVSFSQEKIKGMIMVKDTQDNVSGLEGVSVYWLGTALGLPTKRDGFNFLIKKNTLSW